MEADHKAQIEKIKGSSEQSTKRIWIYVVALSAIMICGGSVIAFLVNPKLGIGLGISGIITYVVAYTMLSYAWIFALGGAVVITIAIALVSSQLIKNRSAIFELVKSFETVKEKNFSDPGVKYEIKKIQSDSTEAIVNEIQKLVKTEEQAAVDVSAADKV